MKRRVLLITAAALMALLMGTVMAHAADMSYDAATHTYTLNNTTLTEPIVLEADSTIIVTGNNWIDDGAGRCIDGVYDEETYRPKYSVTIKGGGTLTLSGQLYAKDFTLNGGTKLVCEGPPGIIMYGVATVTDSELILEHGAINNSSSGLKNTFTNSKIETNLMPGICMGGDTVLTDCVVSTNDSWISVNGYGYALYIIGGKYSISNGRSHSPGLYSYSGKIVIQGAEIKTDTFMQAKELEMTDTTYDAAMFSVHDYGIHIYGDCVISGSTLNLSGENMTHGLYSDGPLTVKDGTEMTISSNILGLGSDKSVTISHSSVDVKLTGDLVSGVLFSKCEPSSITLVETRFTKPANCVIATAPGSESATVLDATTNERIREATLTADHKWDAGTVTKPATTTADGVKTYTCSVCKATKTESIPKTGGSDGTAFGQGADASAAEAAILALKDDKDPKGTAFGILQLKASKITKSSIKLTWKKAPGAKKYIIYSNACGKGKKYQKLTTVTGKSTTIKKVAGKKLAKGKYYKFLMVAVDANNKVVSTSKTVHAATTGGKVGNPTKVTTKAKKNKVTVKVKKTFKLAGKQVGKKVKKHRAVSYETSNAKIATVSKKGVIKGVKKGTCKVYAYAQNGVCAVIKVTVK
ncbi:MAG: Ig-like domain-containing protein [Eubacterium sp.]|nr:Ig-like domain-containing protein [Eubacterium sp.]